MRPSPTEELIESMHFTEHLMCAKGSAQMNDKSPSPSSRGLTNHRLFSLHMSDSKIQIYHLFSHLSACAHICNYVIIWRRDFMNRTLQKGGHKGNW